MLDYDPLTALRDEARELVGGKDRPAAGEATRSYWECVKDGLALTLVEKEMLLFAFLQWVSIALGFYLWVQMLFWIPDEVWESARSSRRGSPADLVLLGWSFICVGVAAFPLGIFSSCMAAVHLMRSAGQPSTIASCMRLTLPQTWRIWALQWWDGWFTVLRILDRLPKRDSQPLSERLADEALYYTWKLAIAGLTPSLLLGRDLKSASGESLDLLRHKFSRLAKLRFGYSLACWVVGIATYVGTLLFLWSDYVQRTLPERSELANWIGSVYAWAGLPMLVSAAAILVVLRPAYLIGLINIYLDRRIERRERIELPFKPGRLAGPVVAFAILLMMLGVVWLYRGPLGIQALLDTPYGS